MRWFALGLFSASSIILLWFRGVSRAHSTSRSYFIKHLGIPVDSHSRLTRKLVKRVSETSNEIKVLRNLHSMLDNSGYRIAWDTLLVSWLWLIAALPMLAVGFSGNIVSAAPAAAAAALLPIPAVKIVRMINRRNIENQSSRFTGDLALYLQCGIPIERSVDLVARDYGCPIKEHLNKVLKELDVGNRPDATLKELAELLDNPELELIAQTVKTSRETGADISKVMESIGMTIRERAAIKRELKTQTVQGKMSGRMVAALPLLFLALTATVSRQTLIILLTTIPGMLMLVVAVVLDIAGFLWINKILNIKI